jgi:hypothetical protein
LTFLQHLDKSYPAYLFIGVCGPAPGSGCTPTKF